MEIKITMMPLRIKMKDVVAIEVIYLLFIYLFIHLWCEQHYYFKGKKQLINFIR